MPIHEPHLVKVAGTTSLLMAVTSPVNATQVLSLENTCGAMGYRRSGSLRTKGRVARPHIPQRTPGSRGPGTCPEGTHPPACGGTPYRTGSGAVACARAGPWKWGKRPRLFLLAKSLGCAWVAGARTIFEDILSRKSRRCHLNPAAMQRSGGKVCTGTKNSARSVTSKRN